MATPICAVWAASWRSACADVGALAQQLGRQAHHDLGWRLRGSARSCSSSACNVARELAEQHRQAVDVLRQRGPQGRHERLGRRKVQLGLPDVEVGRQPGAVAVDGQLQGTLLGPDVAQRRDDPRLQRADLHVGVGDLGVEHHEHVADSPRSGRRCWRRRIRCCAGCGPRDRSPSWRRGRASRRCRCGVCGGATPAATLLLIRLVWIWPSASTLGAISPVAMPNWARAWRIRATACLMSRLPEVARSIRRSRVGSSRVVHQVRRSASPSRSPSLSSWLQRSGIWVSGGT